MARDWLAHFHKIADRWVDDVYVPKPSEVPGIVYHYTDAAGLAGMMRGGVIWATDYRFLNDQSEIEHTKNISRRVVEERDIKSENEMITDFCGKIRNLQNLVSEDDLFVFSLSEARDDLSQWRGYAREGLGFTVGFSAEALSEFALGDGMFSFFKMEYALDKQVDGIKRALVEIEKEVVKQIAEYPDEKASIMQNAANRFDWCADQRAAGNKHKSFKLEQEWRIVTYVAEGHKKTEVKTRVSGQRLVNYTELEISKDGRLPLIAIGIGPGFTSPEQRYAVDALCRETGYKPDIYPADTPYRRL